MEQKLDPFQLYQELLSASFDKIQKLVPKKYKEIKDLTTKFSEQIKADSPRTMDANKYFILYKLCMETKNTKLVELSLYYIQRLISNGFMDCSCKDYTYNIHIEDYSVSEKDAQKHLDPKRKLTEVVVESICQTNYEKEESLQLQVIKVLLTMLISLVVEVHDRSLLQIFRVLYNINIMSKNSVNQTTARAAINQLINIVYQRMEEYNFGGEEWRKSQAAKKQEKTMINGLQTIPIYSQETNAVQAKGEMHSHRDQHIIQSNQEDPSINLEPNINPDLSTIDKSGNANRLFDSFSPKLKDKNQMLETSETRLADHDANTMIEAYIFHTVQCIVDDVVLYDAKVNSVKRAWEGSSKNDPEKYAEELSSVPLRSVPLVFNPNDSKYRRLIETECENEKEQQAGLFGWCFVCRSPTDLYCKDTRVPICSVECKMKHLDEIEDIQNFQTGNQTESQRVNTYLNDAILLFKSVCKMSTRDEIPHHSLKSKILVLEILRGLLENPGPTFLARTEFADVVKEYLCESILKNSVSSDRPVVTLSLGIFVCLVNHFRYNLKEEIAVFIDGVFLKMLESGNSSYYHRLLALQVIFKISQRALTMIEFYVNYDCDVEYLNIVERIMEFLGKIAQGKYSKTEYNTVIQPVQEHTLKTLALESIITFCKSLVRFTDEIEELSKISKPALMSQTTIQNQTMTIIGDPNENIGNQDDDNLSQGGDDTKEDSKEQIERSKTIKTQIQKAILKFNIKPKAGLKYIYSLGLLKEDPTDVAKFLMTYQKLVSKETLGDYFGEEGAFNISVLEAFTDHMTFKKLAIDEAMKHFLSYFDLPGEGQKVDRIVQVFARKYMQDNPTTVYKSATAAYTLSYLLMMLQTSLHNPQVQEKMTLAQFVDLARGLNDGENIPVDTLNGIYARVQKAPLAVPSSEKAKQNFQESSQANFKKRMGLFMKESENMIRESKERIRKGHDKVFMKVQTTEYVRPLFSIMWSPLLASFSILLEQNDEPKIIQLCLEGYVLSVNIAGRYGLDSERDTLVMSLYNFTNLRKGYHSTFKEIREKHLRAIKAILQIGSTQGNSLRTSWEPIVECMSRIDYFLNLNVTLKRDSTKDSEATDNTEIMNRDLIKATIDPNLLDLVFSKSSLFNADEIMDFISCLCRVSEEELKGTNPRTYCLQKIVEVAEYNMGRIKFVWQKIWNIMQEHFSKAGCHPNPSVSILAVDSLKQLALKFLKKEELSNLDFQKEFLKPFEAIFSNLQTESTEIKEFILTCIDHIISHSLHSIKSGWKIIFDVLGASADSDKSILVEISFAIVQKHFSEDLSPLKDSLHEFMQILLKFMMCRIEKICFSAVTLIQKCMSSIVRAHGETQELEEKSISQVKFGLRSPITPSKSGFTNIIEEIGNTHEEVKTNEKNSYYGLTEDSWLMLLSKLAMMATDPRSKIANTGLQILYSILKENGGVFTHEFWQMIMSSVIKLLFDEIQFSFQSKKHGVKDQSFEFFKQNCKLAYTRMLDVFKTHYSKLKDFTPDFLNILITSMQNPHEFLAKISIDAFRAFLNNASEFYADTDWDLIIATLKVIFTTTVPTQLIEARNSEVFENANKTKTQVSIKFNFDEAVTKCVVQLLMIGVVRELIEDHYAKFKEEHINELVAILENSYDFAHSFNEQIFLRYCLWKNGFMKDMNQLPGLLKQEKEALATQTILLHKRYHSSKNETEKKESLEKLLDNDVMIIRLYANKFEEYTALLKEQDSPKLKKDVQAEEAKQLVTEDEESLEAVIRKLKFLELEREIYNLRDSLATAVLPKLVELEVEQIKPRIKEIAHLLISINGRIVLKPARQVKEDLAQEKNEQSNEELDEMIKTLLIKIFDFAMSNLN